MLYGKTPAHRSLFVLKHFIGLFEAAALLTTLPLYVPLSQLLQVAVGSRETLQDRMSILITEERCNTEIKQIQNLAKHTRVTQQSHGTFALKYIHRQVCMVVDVSSTT